MPITEQFKLEICSHKGFTITLFFKRSSIVSQNQLED